jgi:hypothetical protein
MAEPITTITTVAGRSNPKKSKMGIANKPKPKPEELWIILPSIITIPILIISLMSIIPIFHHSDTLVIVSQ